MSIIYKGQMFKSPAAIKMIAVEMAKEFCEINNINYKSLTAYTNTYAMAAMRAMVAKYLRSFGLSINSIGYALNRSNYAVFMYLKSERFN